MAEGVCADKGEGGVMKKERPPWFLAAGFALSFGLILFVVFEFLFMLGGEVHASLLLRFGIFIVAGIVMGLAYAALYPFLKNAKKDRLEY